MEGWKCVGTKGATGVLQMKNTPETEMEGGASPGIIRIIFNVNESHRESD